MLTFNTQFSVQWAFLSFQHFTFLKAFALVETSVLFISKIPPPQIVLR